MRKFELKLPAMTNFWRRVADLYVDGFKNMRVGRQLWALIIIKVFIMFAILKLFFFPDVVKEKTPPGGSEAQTVRTEILGR